jgi:hypothetical protein
MKNKLKSIKLDMVNFGIKDEDLNPKKNGAAKKEEPEEIVNPI